MFLVSRKWKKHRLLSWFTIYEMAIFCFFKTATAQQTMQPLLWVYDWSYTQYYLTWSFITFYCYSNFFRYFCGYLGYLMVIDFFWKIFFSFSGHFQNFLFVVIFYVTIYFHKLRVWKNLFIYKILFHHLFL